MTKSLTIAAATAMALGLALTAAPAARADMLVIGYSHDGASTIAWAGASFLGNLSVAERSVGNFLVSSWASGVNDSGKGFPGLPSPNLDSGVNTISASGAGTLSVYVTQCGINQPLGTRSFNSGFTTNLFGKNITSVTEATYVDPTDGLFTHAARYLASTQTFTSANTGSSDKLYVQPDLVSPYSVTEVYTIVASAAAGDTSSTISVKDVPEPGSLALLGTALLGLVALRQRRRPGRC